MPRAFFLVFLTFFLAVPGAGANDRALDPPPMRTDTPSGLPVPRFVSLKASETSCRSGPSFQHPARLTYQRRALPVMIVAETTDHWRKVRDPEGDECWVHKAKLSGAKTVIALNAVSLRAKPRPDAPLRATFGAGVIARVAKAENGWLMLEADGVKGWAAAELFWGAYTAADYVAPQN